MDWKKVLTCSTSALALTFAAGAAYGQASSDQVETVVVTGVRASLGSAQEIKKNSDQMIDSVVAEDIGKLPDSNVIEALQHITGVQVRRDGSEAFQLLIRGLPNIATLVNGREIFTSTGRFVTLADIPAELLARVDVHKSSQAGDLEGGIAGLVDVRLHRPFDFDGLEIAGGAHATYSSVRQQIDPDASFLISNRWQTSIGEIGLLFDVSYAKRHYEDQRLFNYLSTQTMAHSASPTGTAYFPLTSGGIDLPGDRERASVNLAAQWRPNANTEVFAEVFYTRFRNPNYVDYFIGLPWIGASESSTTLFPGTDEAKTVTSGWYELTSTQSYRPKTDTYQAATGVTWTGNNVTLSTELDYTNSKYFQTGYIIDLHTTGMGGDAYYEDFNYQGTGTPYIDITGFDMTDPANFNIRQFYDWWIEQTGNEIDWRGDLSYDMGDGGWIEWIKSVDMGVRYTNRFARNRQDNYSGLDCDSAANPSSPQYAQQLLKDASWACWSMWQPSASMASIPGSWHLSTGKIFEGDRDFGVRQWITPDPEWLVDHITDIRTMFGQSTAAPAVDPANSFDMREESYAGYAKANFGFMFGSLPVDGNFGLRIINTKANLKGNTLVVSEVTPGNYTFTYTATESQKETTDLMPSLNARLKIQDDLFLRLAASRTVTRPEFPQLNPGLTLTNSTATLLGSGSSGNPDLSPIKSSNADLSLEYYFGPQNMLTGAVFYRQIDGYIQTFVDSEVIGGITYNISKPQNSGQGWLQGVEVGYTQFFDFLPGLWSGLGAQANATFIEGRTDAPGSVIDKIGFANVSKWSYNLVGIYEYGPISFRTAYNWRGGYIDSFNSGGHQPNTIYVKPTKNLDFSASYRYDDNITFTLDATNLLGSIYQDYFGDPVVYPRDTRRYDRTVWIGLRYRL